MDKIAVKIRDAIIKIKISIKNVRMRNTSLRKTPHQWPLTYSLLFNSALIPAISSSITIKTAKLNQIAKIIPGIKKKKKPPIMINPETNETHRNGLIFCQPLLKDSLILMFSALSFIAYIIAVCPHKLTVIAITTNPIIRMIAIKYIKKETLELSGNK